MRQNNLFDLLQNDVVGTIALHAFTLGYYNISKIKRPEKPYPPIKYFFFVLPIVYNRKAMNVIKGSRDLYSAILKDSSIILDLQERANKMSIKTFESLHLAFSKRILRLNIENKTIEMADEFRKKGLPTVLDETNIENSVKKIQTCARKLGAIFAKRDEKNIQFELNIRL